MAHSVKDKEPFQVKKKTSPLLNSVHKTKNEIVKWYNSTTRIGILRIPRDFTEMYLSSMFYMKEIATIPCSLHILHISGTVIFVQQKAIEWDRKFYLKEQQYADSKGNIDRIKKRSSYSFFKYDRSKL